MGVGCGAGWRVHSVGARDGLVERARGWASRAEVVAALMALAPRTEMMFVAFTCVYAFVMGFCYAAFGAVVLEAIGAGAAATKYNLLAGISNAPIIYQTMIDGWGHDRWGASG